MVLQERLCTFSKPIYHQKMSYSIFYDLETSGLDRCNQILNFAFIVTDKNFNTIDSLTGDVKLSRLQLPSAGAIAATKLDVFEHQEKAELTELQAVQQIASFFEKYKGATLIGYNSARFDLPFLRTVFIRNGENPYFFKQTYKDIYLSIKTLQATETFKTENRKLETIAKFHGLLEGEQKHESLADVELTINLTKELLKRYNHDARTFDYYQVRELHKEEPGSVFMLDRLGNSFPATLLDHDSRYALWIDVKEEPQIRWMKYSEQPLVQNTTLKPTAEQIEKARHARDKFQKVNLENYFQETTCYIEEDIYRLPAEQIGQLGKAQRTNSLPLEASTDFKLLFQRYALENSKSDLSRYAKFRYGGQLELKSGRPHPKLAQMFLEIEKVKEKYPKIMGSLNQWYQQSEIVQAHA